MIGGGDQAQNKYGIRRRLLRLMLSGSLLGFFFLGLPLLYGWYELYSTIGDKANSLAQAVSYYTTDFAKEQGQEQMESETEIRAAIIGYEAGAVQEDVKYLFAEVTEILRAPEKFTSQKLPNAREEAIPAGNVYVHFSPELVERGVSGELAQEIGLLSNVASAMEHLGQYYACIFVGSKHGYIIRLEAAAEEGALSSLSREPWRTTHDSRQRYWYQLGEKAQLPVFTQVYEGVDGKAVISCVMPYYDKDGLAGVVGVDCAPENFLPVEATGITRSFVLGDKGDVLLSAVPQEILPTAEWGEDLRDCPVTSLAFAARRMVQGSTGYRKVRLEGEEYYLSYAPVPKLGWSVGTLLEKKEVTAAADRARVHMMGQMADFRSSFARLFLSFGAVAILILLLVFVLMSWGSSRAAEHFCRPLRKLMAATREIARGNFDRRIDVHTGDELEHLALCMGDMTGQLERYEQEIASTAKEKSRIETELSVAAHIQTSLLPPPLPHRQEFQLAAAMYPAREVGGDFYDFYYVEKDKLVVTIGDVAGKGVSAALFMAVAKTVLKNCIMVGHDNLSRALEKANDQLVDQNEENMPVAVFAGLLELSTGRFVYVHAGHSAPLLMRRHGEAVSGLPSGQDSPVMGITPGVAYEEKHVRLADGDRLLLYTDGVTEAMDGTKNFFFSQRLEKLLSLLSDRAAPEEIIEAVRQGVGNFVGQAEQFDDMTMLAVKYRGDIDGLFPTVDNA